MCVCYFKCFFFPFIIIIYRLHVLRIVLQFLVARILCVISMYTISQPTAISTRVVPIQYNGPINKKNRFLIFSPEKITGKTSVIGGKLGEKSIRRNTACRIHTLHRYLRRISRIYSV